VTLIIIFKSGFLVCFSIFLISRPDSRMLLLHRVPMVGNGNSRSGRGGKKHGRQNHF
jgi:hypothetical protein